MLIAGLLVLVVLLVLELEVVVDVTVVVLEVVGGAEVIGTRSTCFSVTSIGICLRTFTVSFFSSALVSFLGTQGVMTGILRLSLGTFFVGDFEDERQA